MSPNYKGMRTNLLGLPITKEKNKGPKISFSKRFYGQSFSSPFEKNSPKNLIVLYDISEDRKKERDWFRRQLIRFDYKMIQRSVWVGPSPLPKDFLNYLKEIKIGDNFKTFKLVKPYTKNNKEI